MADPFGTGAGIVGVIGVAIQITQVAVQFGMDWKDAPENVKTFMAELGTLKTILSETNTNIILNPDFAAAFQSRPSSLLSQLGPNALSKTDTELILETCRRELESLLNELKKRGKGHRLGWERFKGAFLAKNTRESVENLSRQCQTLNKMLSIDAAVLGTTTYKEVREARQEQQEWRQAETKTSSAIKSAVNQSNRWQENHDFQAVLNWLTPIDYAGQQSDFIHRRQPGTVQWFLDSAEFQRWLETGKQTLFCPGIPGAGKTILTSIVVEDLNTRFQNDKSIGVAYIYCNFRQQDQQKAEALLASLLKQLIQGLSSLPESAKTLYNHYKDRRTRPSLDEISRTLNSVVAMYSRVYIIIDALDECQLSDGCRTRFLTEIFAFQAKYGANIFATSRPMPEIITKFNNSTSLEIRARDEDVRKYLDNRISQSESRVLKANYKQIKTQIAKAVDGMFLLAQLHFDSIATKKTLTKIKKALESLSTGSEAYNHAYEDAMERIEDQDTDSKELAKHVLSWIICAKRPLTMSELQYALAVEISDSELDKENLPQVEDMILVCAGLVTVDNESKIIRLVHYTTQEYFDRTRGNWFPNAEANITLTCVTYLSFKIFEYGFCQTDSEFEERLRSNPFYKYAAQNWGHHARQALKYIPEVIEFLKTEDKVNASVQALVAVRQWSGYSNYSQGFSRQMTGLHLAAYFGVKEAINPLLQICRTVDFKDSYGRTPLLLAAVSGHEAVVQLLLEKGAEVDSEDNCGRTALSWAAKNEHGAVVQLLLEGAADIDSKDGSGQTPLSLAAQNGCEAVVQLLLEKGAEVDSMDSGGRTPLSWAVMSGHEAVIQLLLEGGADIDWEDSSGKTPLSWAAENEHEAVVQLLLEKGAEGDSKDSYGRTLLSWAVINGHEAVTQLLLEGGADIDSKDGSGQTPLSLAAENGREAVVRLLLKKDAEVDSKDRFGWTPLSWAAENRYEAVVQLLLEKGAEVNSKDRYGRTPLEWAAVSGHETLVELLLKKGAKKL